MKALWSCLGLLVSILLGLFILVGVPMLFAGVLPLGQLPELIDRYAIQPVSGSIPSSLVEWGTTTSEIHPSAASVSNPTRTPTSRLISASKSTPNPTSGTLTVSSRGRLDEIPCGPDCQWDYEPAISAVEWLNGPSITADGTLTLTARLNKGTRLILPGRSGGASNIALSDGGTRLYGTVVPPARGGWNWNPEPGLWIARVYEYDGTSLNVLAKIDRVAAGHRGLQLCLWTGGKSAELLDCVKVEQP